MTDKIVQFHTFHALLYEDICGKAQSTHDRAQDSKKHPILSNFTED